MYFDRFDIVQAHYWFACNYHGGQWSPLYARLCRISRYYRPGALENGPEGENAIRIYRVLVRAFLQRRDR
jgi:hypothetical protein